MPYSIDADILKMEEICIQNLTSKRIGIESQDKKENLLLLPPFGKRILLPKEYNDFRPDHNPWERLNLIKVKFNEKEDSKDTSQSSESTALYLAIGLIFFIFVGGSIWWLANTLLGAKLPDNYWNNIIIVSGILFALGLAFQYSKKLEEYLNEFKKQLKPTLKNGEKVDNQAARFSQ